MPGPLSPFFLLHAGVPGKRRPAPHHADSTPAQPSAPLDLRSTASRILSLSWPMKASPGENSRPMPTSSSSRMLFMSCSDTSSPCMAFGNGVAAGSTPLVAPATLEQLAHASVGPQHCLSRMAASSQTHHADPTQVSGVHQPWAPPPPPPNSPAPPCPCAPRPRHRPAVAAQSDQTPFASASDAS